MKDVISKRELLYAGYREVCESQHRVPLTLPQFLELLRRIRRFAAPHKPAAQGS